MKNINVLTTLFVGIDVSARTNVCLVMDFNSNVLLEINIANNKTGSNTLKAKLLDLIHRYDFKTTIVALESTSFYGLHISNSLSADGELIPHNVYVHPLNPKMISNYIQSFIGLGKTVPIDVYIIADFARVGRITTEPWKGPQYLALQRLTRHHLHLVKCITREKSYMISNIFLKFSKLAVLKEAEHPFSSNHTATAEAILTKMLSLEDLISLSFEDLIEFVCSHSKKRYSNPEDPEEV